MVWNKKDLIIGLAIECVSVYFLIILDSFSLGFLLFAVIFAFNFATLVTNRTYLGKQVWMAYKLKSKLRESAPKNWDITTDRFTPIQKDPNIWKIYVGAQEKGNTENWTNDWTIYDSKNDKYSTKIFDNIKFWSKYTKKEKLNWRS